MKDVLQKSESPYDVLGRLPLDATNADIHKAFTAAIKKFGAARANAARTAIQDPTRRALIDLFEYDEAALPQAAPSPLDDASVLEPSRRLETARAWERLLRKRLPDVALTHNLAVLWYWWADRAPEVLDRNGAAGSAQPSPVELWERAVAYWATILATDAFWQSRPGFTTELSATVRARVEENLRARLRDACQHYQDQGEPELAQQLRLVDQKLSYEIRAAEQLRVAGVGTQNGRLACGVLFLQHLQMLPAIHQSVTKALEKNPANAKLRAASLALSPLGMAEFLIDTEKPAEALAELDHLGVEEKEKPEARALRGRALIGVGNQQASLSQPEEAVESWGAALACPGSEAEAREFIITTCRTQATTWRHTQLDQAIQLLERGVALVNDENLRLLLGDLLGQRGFRTLREAQDEAERGLRMPASIQEVMRRANQEADAQRWDAAITLLRKALAEVPTAKPDQKVMDKLRRGLGDLERAAKLGDRASIEQLSAARKMVQQVGQGGQGIREVIRQNLAVSLTERAVTRVNAAMGGTGLLAQTREGMVAALESSERDLLEAQSLVPGDAHVQKTLTELRLLKDQLQHPERYAPAAGARAAARTAPPDLRTVANRVGVSLFYWALLIGLIALIVGAIRGNHDCQTVLGGLFLTFVVVPILSHVYNSIFGS